MLIANILMLVGGFAWLAGELYGVFRKGRGRDTTSDWVWWLEARVPFVRVLVGVFVVSLFGHLLFGWMLLP